MQPAVMEKEADSLNLAPVKQVKPVIVSSAVASNGGLIRAHHKNMTNDEYHRDRTAVSSSGLKEVLRSPMHFYHYLNTPHEERNVFRLGTAIHASLLEPARFAKEYVIAPDAGRSKDSKAAYQEFVEAHPNSFFLSQSEMDMISGICEQVDKHAFAKKLLSMGVSEESFFWTDEETGILCKVRTDCLASKFAILDVKSTEDASSSAFSRSCANYNYDLSAAFYQEGVYQVTGEELDFAFLAVEKKAPHGVALYRASDEMLEKGRNKFRKALRLIKECRDNNSYPSYQPNGAFEDLDMPRWAK